MNRREFVHATTLGGTIGLAAPNLFAEIPGTDDPVLVVIQLTGGNDGLNTVVPIGNDHYYRARPNLAIKAKDAIRINESTGFHPALAGMAALLDDGQLAVIEGVGYPNPNRSHFRSTEILHTASGTDQVEKLGWIGRYFDTHCQNAPASVGICFGTQKPQAFDATSPKGIALSSSQKTTMYKSTNPATPFPATRLGMELQMVSRLIQDGTPSRIYHLSRGGFDTHINQAEMHAALMKETGDALLAFNRELKATGNNGRVCTLVYSEFGRRMKENASGGTDHGTAAPIFVMGGKVKGGFHGKRPSLTPDRLVMGDLAHTVDYRSVYATLLEKHMGVGSQPILPRKFPTLGFI